jgi:hypothetical protein
MSTQTTQAAALVTQVIMAVADTIREMGPQGAPSGVIYSALMGMGISLNAYQRIVSLLVQSGRVEQRNNVLYWVEVSK